MAKKNSKEQMLEISFYTRNLAGMNFTLFLEALVSNYQKIKNGERLPDQLVLEFIRGYAVVRDIVAIAAYPEELKKCNISNDQLHQCREMVDFFEKKKSDVSYQPNLFKGRSYNQDLYDLFSRFVPTSVNNKPHI